MPKTRKPTIAFITGDWSWGTDPLQPNGCAWYRCKLPLDELKKHKWVTGLGFPGFSHEKGFGLIINDGQIIHGWDIIVFKLLMQKQVLECMDRAKELGQKIIVDVDDWFNGLAKTNQAYAITDPKNNPENNREIYAEIIKKSDGIITSTPFLFNYYSKIHKNVYMVRNGIDIKRWPPIKLPFRKRQTIGWVGATPWRSNDLEQLNPWFSDYLKNNHFRFHHSGATFQSTSVAEILSISPKYFRQTPLVPILSYPYLFAPIDIGIVPLNNIEFNHAKSFIKGLEYAAAGVPFISSYSPEYQYLADNGIGRIANTQDEWIAHFDELKNLQVRRDEIAHNYELLENFSMQKRGVEWDETFRKILEKV